MLSLVVCVASGAMWPFWFLLFLSAYIPARWAIRRIMVTKALREPGHCLVCNYDLRATPERCPECGAIPEKVKA